VWGEVPDFYSGKRVAVTGATGLNGSYIVKALVERGARVRAIMHERPPNEYTKMAHEIVSADLLDSRSTAEAVKGVEIVMHAAGVAGGAPLAIKDPGAMVAPNAIINSQVIQACSREKIDRLGFLSSIVVYPAIAGPMTEEQAWSGEPYDLYFGLAWVKRFSEKLCKFYYDKCGLKSAIIRPSGSYGRYDNFDENTSHVLPAIIKRALSGADPLKVWGDGNDIRDFIHASDIARGLLMAVENYSVCDPVNIASGIDCSTKQLAQTILDIIGSHAVLELDPTKPSALRERRVDISKAKKVLGFSSLVPLRVGLTDTINFLQKKA
jgi:GDP-L-fucose synthase